jgi:hypothetical protein
VRKMVNSDSERVSALALSSQRKTSANELAVLSRGLTFRRKVVKIDQQFFLYASGNEADEWYEDYSRK